MKAKTIQPAKSAIGARVQFCGHNGWFIADIIRIGNATAVRANGPVTPSNIHRTEIHTITHRLTDFPSAGLWQADRGIFVVPEAQVTEVPTDAQ